jgi:hypothetical protein
VSPLSPAGSPGPHATADEIALFVIDGLALAARQRFEGHVAACSSCARALAAEAVVEQDLAALWPRVRRPLAEVVPLRRPRPALPAAPPVRRAPAARKNPAHQSSFGGLAAAMVAVLFLGWWTDAGRNMAGVALDAAPGDPTALPACWLPGGQATSGNADEVVACMAPDGPPLGALASWGMCVGRSPRAATGRCPRQSDLLCPGPGPALCR